MNLIGEILGTIVLGGLLGAGFGFVQGIISALWMRVTPEPHATTAALLGMVVGIFLGPFLHLAVLRRLTSFGDLLRIALAGAVLGIGAAVLLGPAGWASAYVTPVAVVWVAVRCRRATAQRRHPAAVAGQEEAKKK